MSSDTSDDENLALLREAVDYDFINDSMFNLNKPQKDEDTMNDQKLPSLRRPKQDDQFNVLCVTPEFQTHVANRLSLKLDKQLQSRFTANCVGTYSERTEDKKCGIKLFANSKHFVEVGTQEDIVVSSKRKQIKKRKLEDCDDNEESKAKMVAVSPEYVLLKNDVKFWSTRSKAEVFTYRKMKNGQLISVDNLMT